MKIAVTLTETDLRNLVYSKLEGMLPAEVTGNFGNNRFVVKTSYGEKEKWRQPAYIQMHIEREIAL